MIYIQISTAQGPAECRIFARFVLGRLLAEAKAEGVEVEIISETADKHGMMSAVLKLDGKHAETLAQRWQGSLQWICASPVRPKHPRKNWYIGVFRMPDMPEMPSETLRGLATLAREAVAPYAKAGKVRFYQSGEEVVPGMRSRPSPGHTPGHNGIEFTSKGQTMLVWGDLMHNHTLQMLDPEIAIEFDSDPKQARASRQDALKDAATRKIWIAGAHMPFPSIGHIRAESNGATLGCRWNIPRSKSTAKCNNLTKTDRTFLRGSRQMTAFLCYGDFSL